MKEKNKALIMLIICIIIGFTSPFSNFYLEQEADKRNTEIYSPGLIPWQFTMLFCMLGAFVSFIIYINPTIVEGDK